MEKIYSRTDQATWFSSPIDLMGQQAYQIRGYIEEECSECEAPRMITSSHIITQFEIDMSKVRLEHIILRKCISIRKELEVA